MKKISKITAIITIVLGVVAIILGATLMGEVVYHNTEENTHNHSAGYYYVEGAAFGADFYTYMYDASDVIVDELCDINIGIASVVDAQNDIITNTAAAVRATDQLTETVGKVGGMIVIAIGLAISAYGIQCVGKAFAPEAECAMIKEDDTVMSAEEEAESEVADEV